MWYVGSRTAKNCHPLDGYICSSRHVKPLIKANPTEWTREIIAVGTAKEMRELEKEILVLFEAHKDKRSFNLTNTSGKMVSKEPWNKGKKGLQVSWNKGLTGEQHHNFGKKYNVVAKKQYPEVWREELIKRNKQLGKVSHTCPHCQQTGEGNAMLRWHFANCRLKGGK